MNAVKPLLSQYQELPDVSMDLLVPYPYLIYAQELLRDTSIIVGAQNMSVHEQGAYTGQVSGAILNDIGVRTVMIGHQEVSDSLEERREKLVLASRLGMRIIYCVGTQGDQLSELDEQIDCLTGSEEVLVAYEPASAIGSGVCADYELIKTQVAAIRKRLAASFSGKSEPIKVMYGGSVNNKNCLEIVKKSNVDGLLVGGVSLNFELMLEVIRLCKQYS